MVETPPRDHLLSSKLYDFLKVLAQIYLPALGTLYFALAGLWNLPSAQEVVGTIVVVDTFLGTVLSVSTHSYDQSNAKFAGVIDIEKHPVNGNKVFTLNLNDHPETLEDKDQAIFKVNPLEKV